MSQYLHVLEACEPPPSVVIYPNSKETITINITIVPYLTYLVRL